MVAEMDKNIEQIEPGLYVFRDTRERMQQISPLSDEKLEELIGPIPHESVKKYIRQRYREATRPPRWFEFWRPRRRGSDKPAA